MCFMCMYFCEGVNFKGFIKYGQTFAVFYCYKLMTFISLFILVTISSIINTTHYFGCLLCFKAFINLRGLCLYYLGTSWGREDLWSLISFLQQSPLYVSPL